ncbi:uncharacterized protein BT62DRAFT_380957 [Guyanagaster necrorhizus]|uniref:BHLH domain-containing protein n=1 Tax=Guyanagaster necrorhizus TaxID=856835 RepID=A0A9P8AQ09_9AGAR|nr:uncharacterized protein BT62DRAFT_380957 [Guyanagaster necrorhizus MCA 3950]KAG7442387.1 hypothetical protein BT62DRAFT_380957 [Guyanagaster necrorhizus MCA 3950]
MSHPNSPASDNSDSSNPRTPTSPTLPLSPDAAAPPSIAPSKRKPSRRANTAERRATHNAVERQRRETLNGRFLDLAALLPNLSQIRRPSKSSIVNSSIAHVHASRRHRLLAARELRAMKMEADALRRELNEWRDRAAVPRVEEPVRGEGFGMIISGELEVLGVAGEEEDYADEDGPMGSGYDDAPPPPPPTATTMYHGHHPHAHGHGHGRSPVIASPTNMHFENPQMGYENYTPIVAPAAAAAYYGGSAQPFFEEKRFAAPPPAFDAYQRPRSGGYDAYEGMIVGGGGAPGAAAFLYILS